jgi:hypothetical protein
MRRSGISAMRPDATAEKKRRVIGDALRVSAGIIPQEPRATLVIAAGFTNA